MIADDREGPLEVAVKILACPIWLPLYCLWMGCVALGQAIAARRVAKPEPTVVELVPQMWTPASDLERQVFAAMILAGRPVTNAELARLMGVSAAEASKRVAELQHLLDQGVLHKQRVGREVRISLPHYH